MSFLVNNLKLQFLKILQTVYSIIKQCIAFIHLFFCLKYHGNYYFGKNVYLTAMLLIGCSKLSITVFLYFIYKYEYDLHFFILIYAVQIIQKGLYIKI